MESSKRDSLRIMIKKFLQVQESSIILITIFFFIVVQVVNSAFLSASNIVNILRSTSYLLITSCGMTFVLIAGNIDLSISTVMGLGGIIFGLMITSGIPIILALLITLVVATIVGTINGLLIHNFRVPPMIMTLGMQYIAKGVVQVLTKGTPVYPLPESFTKLDSVNVLGIPLIAVIAFMIALISGITLKKTRFGREIYAVGGNVEASKLSGINIRKIYIWIFIVSSILAMFGGIAMTARVGSGQASTGTGYELNSIVAAIIGGTSINGGAGGIAGTVLGALFVMSLQNGLLMLKVNIYWQQLFIGVVLVLAVIWDQYRRSQQLRKL